jgi:hypothetical protein
VVGLAFDSGFGDVAGSRTKGVCMSSFVAKRVGLRSLMDDSTSCLQCGKMANILPATTTLRQVLPMRTQVRSWRQERMGTVLRVCRIA